MLTVEIPGRAPLTLNHLVLDYNGTIAEDGIVIRGIAERLEELKNLLSICVITADTHGTAAKHCEGLPLEVLTYPTVEVGTIKAEQVKALSGGVVCIGNGYNDILMSDAADLSIAVIGKEGCCGALLQHADVVVTDILDALDLLLKQGRLRATLRT